MVQPHVVEQRALAETHHHRVEEALALVVGERRPGASSQVKPTPRCARRRRHAPSPTSCMPGRGVSCDPAFCGVDDIVFPSHPELVDHELCWRIAGMFDALTYPLHKRVCTYHRAAARHCGRQQHEQTLGTPRIITFHPLRAGILRRIIGCQWQDHCRRQERALKLRRCHRHQDVESSWSPSATIKGAR
jgi:hypothetical protein